MSLQRIRTTVIALAVGAGALVLAPPASAQVQAPPVPSVTKVTMNPASPVVLFGDSVKVTFTITTKDADKAGMVIIPPGVSTQPVVAAKPAGKDTFTVERTVGTVGKWNYTVTASNGDKAGEPLKGSFDVKKALETKIVRFDANPDRITKGDRVRLSAQLRAGDQGYGGQEVALAFRSRGSDDFRKVTTTKTSRNGWFSAAVRPWRSGEWRAEFGGNAEAKASVSDGDYVSVRPRVRTSAITGFDAAPEPVTKGDRLRFKGALTVEGEHGLRGERVTIQFRPIASRQWQNVTGDRTSRHGRFHASATAEQSGWWRAVYDGDRRIKGSVSGPDFVRVAEPVTKADTRVIGFNAYPEPAERGRYLKFRALLQVDDDGTWEGYEGKVDLYFKAKRSGEYRLVTSVTTDDDGRAYAKARAWTSGHWRFVHAGDDETNGDTSRSDYVRVRR
ncbi:hypothetical protein OUY22_24390 [Nonomuraea sp. MCN248]|uniref:Uncharacterized protein n=1 Tax=Nonomuraea corallina TaxID=2989783 RepID=A0ABT4SH78_9ACTN|nr:hypothetical protein [Nonomuraea corallina]MDA0636567.1 hypothetical protein [Nonomuraea corallina]